MLKWEVKINGADKTLYENQTFILRFIFDDKYPFEPPQVYFIGKNIPVHPHIYANGHICLSILSTEWTPALTVESICISIISMLSSCRKKVRPPDNDAYIQYAPSNPKLTNWFIHDNTV
ncbi:hypothetical protein SNEBB_000416 [Seison nebaliae]|nr:hypothetical protein SNEBB_000416 [Seison nebaliae]